MLHGILPNFANYSSGLPSREVPRLDPLQQHKLLKSLETRVRPVKSLPREDQDRIRRQDECRRMPEVVHDLLVRKDATAVADHIRIYP